MADEMQSASSENRLVWLRARWSLVLLVCGLSSFDPAEGYGIRKLSNRWCRCNGGRARRRQRPLGMRRSTAGASGRATQDLPDRAGDAAGVVLGDEVLAGVDLVDRRSQVTRQPLPVGQLLEAIGGAPDDRRGHVERWELRREVCGVPRVERADLAQEGARPLSVVVGVPVDVDRLRRALGSSWPCRRKLLRTLRKTLTGVRARSGPQARMALTLGIGQESYATALVSTSPPTSSGRWTAAICATPPPRSWPTSTGRRSPRCSSHRARCPAWARKEMSRPLPARHERP